MGSFSSRRVPTVARSPSEAERAGLPGAGGAGGGAQCAGETLSTFGVSHGSVSSPGHGGCKLCPPSWQLSGDHKCYYFSENRNDWNTSLENCKALEASLTSIDSLEELVRTGHEPQHRLWCGKCVGLEQNPISPPNFTHCQSQEKMPWGKHQPGLGSAFCHTEKYWICSRPNNYVLWRQKISPE
uniref:C-type lectin domain-containing protein n=1 Tax=Anas platyrhynchos TaxID=8839 RepID=A0A8B9T2E2_ANAPL